MQYQYITYDEQDGIGTLTLNRPDKLNALNADMIDEMIVVLDHVAATREARVLLITGAGKAFCGGADLAAPRQGSGQNAILETHYNRLLARLAELSCPIIAAINGAAVGAGCSIALLSDFVIASEDSYFLQAFVNIGLVPDMGATWLLPRLIGVARTTELLMLGEKLPATKAEEWGLLYKVVAADSLDDEVERLATRLAQGPTLAYGLIRQGIRFGLEHSLMETVQVERRGQLQTARSRDFQEGVEAFQSRRPPRFSGR